VNPKFYLWIVFLFVIPSSAQTAPVRIAPPPAPPSAAGPPIMDEDDARSRVEHDLEKKAAKERMEALRSDTDKLLKLSVELKSYVDKSDENVLSLDVIKKAEAIEKLAKSVKEKMKGPN